MRWTPSDGRATIINPADASMSSARMCGQFEKKKTQVHSEPTGMKRPSRVTQENATIKAHYCLYGDTWETIILLFTFSTDQRMKRVWLCLKSILCVL